MAMFNKTSAPVKWGLIRAGMSSRLYIVKDVFPDPYGREDTWLCAVYRAGYIKNGVWHPVGGTQCGPHGEESVRWRTVSLERNSYNPVAMGEDCPTPPGQMGSVLQQTV